MRRKIAQMLNWDASHVFSIASNIFAYQTLNTYKYEYISVIATLLLKVNAILQIDSTARINKYDTFCDRSERY